MKQWLMMRYLRMELIFMGMFNELVKHRFSNNEERFCTYKGWFKMTAWINFGN
jgi:hypothetical protein